MICNQGGASPKRGERHAKELTMSPKELLRENLTKLMIHRLGKVNMLRTAHLCGVGLGSIQRAMEANTAVGLEVIEKLAVGLGVEPWQMIAPGLDPATASQQRAVNLSPLAIDLAEHLDDLARQPLLHARAAAMANQTIELVMEANREGLASTQATAPARGEAGPAAEASPAPRSGSQKADA